MQWKKMILKQYNEAFASGRTTAGSGLFIKAIWSVPVAELKKIANSPLNLGPYVEETLIPQVVEKELKREKGEGGTLEEWADSTINNTIKNLYNDYRNKSIKANKKSVIYSEIVENEEPTADDLVSVILQYELDFNCSKLGIQVGRDNCNDENKNEWKALRPEYQKSLKDIQAMLHTEFSTVNKYITKYNNLINEINQKLNLQLETNVVEQIEESKKDKMRTIYKTNFTDLTQDDIDGLDDSQLSEYGIYLYLSEKYARDYLQKKEYTPKMVLDQQEKDLLNNTDSDTNSQTQDSESVESTEDTQ